jgi:glycosyltransferase involved in cell wall biosynthesis
MSYIEKDPRVRVFLNEKNLGDYPNRNRAASYSKGMFIMFCDSDDTLEKEGVKMCVESMLKHSKSKFGIYWVYEKVEPFSRTPFQSAKKNFFGEPFLGMGPGGTIINREYFISIGGFPVKYGPANDMYYNLKAICYTDVLLLPFKFSNYRIHENQERNNIEKYLLNNYLYFKDALNELPIQLSHNDINWLLKKNKRRFLFNTLKYFFSTFKFKEVKRIYKLSEFKLNDVVIAIFQI